MAPDQIKEIEKRLKKIEKKLKRSPSLPEDFNRSLKKSTKQVLQLLNQTLERSLPNHRKKETKEYLAIKKSLEKKSSKKKK